MCIYCLYTVCILNDNCPVLANRAVAAADEIYCLSHTNPCCVHSDYRRIPCKLFQPFHNEHVDHNEKHVKPINLPFSID